MSVELQLDCTGAHGSAASFVTAVNFYVDGVLVKVVEHTPVPGEPDRWTFSVPFDFEGTHTIRVTDTAASGPTEYFVADSELVCSVTVTTPAPEPTATPAVPAPETTIPVTVASVPGTAAAETTVATPAPESTATTVVPTTASVLAETVSVAPATLPATGAATGPMTGAGLGFVLAGLVAVVAARRRFHGV